MSENAKGVKAFWNTEDVPERIIPIPDIKGTEEEKATARLMSAAPAMLEALEKIQAAAKTLNYTFIEHVAAEAIQKATP